jgi:CRISPR-associated protein Cmr5
MPTLDQRRAQFAWEHAQTGTGLGSPHGRGYANMAKGASALIMSNGLMQTLAYYQSRTGNNSTEAEKLATDMLLWLQNSNVLVFPDGAYIADGTFNNTMNALLHTNSTQYMRATQEIMAMLRWLRQFADVLKPER